MCLCKRHPDAVHTLCVGTRAGTSVSRELIGGEPAAADARPRLHVRVPIVGVLPLQHADLG